MNKYPSLQKKSVSVQINGILEIIYDTLYINNAAGPRQCNNETRNLILALQLSGGRILCPAARNESCPYNSHNLGHVSGERGGIGQVL